MCPFFLFRYKPGAIPSQIWKNNMKKCTFWLNFLQIRGDNDKLDFLQFQVFSDLP